MSQSTFTVKISDFCNPQTLRVDMATLFQLSESHKSSASGGATETSLGQRSQVFSNFMPLFQSFDLTLPVFTSRYISVSGLKRLFGHPNEMVLRKAGDKWEFVPDGQLIDLSDRSFIYRIGAVESVS
jgi:hypothetical protein